MIDWNGGKMDGFTHWGRVAELHDAAYAYIDRSQVAPYWAMAHQYVLADAMFPTEFGPSWTGHVTLVAGRDSLGPDLALADFAVGGHSNCKAAPNTRLRSFIWSPFAAIKYVYQGADWDGNVVVPQTRVLTDIARGRLAAVSWVTPSHRDSDHPGAHDDRGPSWVTSIVNAVGESAYWIRSTLTMWRLL
jgi:phospholipase C